LKIEFFTIRGSFKLLIEPRDLAEFIWIETKVFEIKLLNEMLLDSKEV